MDLYRKLHLRRVGIKVVSAVKRNHFYDLEDVSEETAELGDARSITKLNPEWDRAGP